MSQMAEQKEKKSELDLAIQRVKAEFPDTPDKDASTIANYLVKHVETEGEKLAKQIDAKIRSAYSKGKSDGKKSRKASSGRSSDSKAKKLEKEKERARKELERLEKQKQKVAEKVEKLEATSSTPDET